MFFALSTTSCPLPPPPHRNPKATPILVTIHTKPLCVAKDMHGMNEVHYSTAERRSEQRAIRFREREPLCDYFLQGRQ